MHRKEVTHSNGSYERKSRGRKLADEMRRAKNFPWYTHRPMHRKRVTCELHDSYFRLMTIKHSISKIEWASNDYITQLSSTSQLSCRRDVVGKATSGRWVEVRRRQYSNIKFPSMGKSYSLAHIPVDYILHSAIPTLGLLKCKFVAFTYYMTNWFRTISK